LLQIKIASEKAKGNVITEQEEQKFLNEITDRYKRQLSPYYAAARLWIDGIIDPVDTREVISAGIEAANHAPISRKFNVGVIQT